MTFEALSRLARDERFDFGCHTITHPALPFLDADEQEHEMREAQRLLQDRISRVVPIVEEAWQWNPRELVLRDYYASSLMTFSEVKRRGWPERKRDQAVTRAAAEAAALR